MKDLIWKDVTPFSQNDKERIPQSWMLKIGRFTIIVHRHIPHKYTWMLTCLEMGGKIDLHTDVLEEAQVAAVETMISLAEKRIAEMTELVDALRGGVKHEKEDG